MEKRSIRAILITLNNNLRSCLRSHCTIMNIHIENLWCISVYCYSFKFIVFMEW